MCVLHILNFASLSRFKSFGQLQRATHKWMTVDNMYFVSGFPLLLKEISKVSIDKMCKNEFK